MISVTRFGSPAVAEPALEQVPWLGHFKRDPAGALDELLRGIADVAPYERAEPVDVLLALFGSLPKEDPPWLALDRALSSWLVSRRKDDPEVRRRYGLSRYVDELIQALVAVYRLPLPETAAMLHRELTSFDVWLHDLYLGPARDPAGELWRVMAQTQRDRSLLEEWYRLCEEAGRSLPEHWIDIGLLGLRRLPQPGDREPSGTLEVEVLDGLFRWAARLPPGSASHEAFERRFATLLVLYPRAPARWRQLVHPLLSRDPRAPFLEWLNGIGFGTRHEPAPVGHSGTVTTSHRGEESQPPPRSKSRRPGPTLRSRPMAAPATARGADRVPEADLGAAIEQLRRGERTNESVREIHRIYYPRLRAYFARRVRSPQDVEDLTQETFLKIYINIGRYRGESRFSTWVFAIARNALFRRSRRAESQQSPAPGKAGTEFEAAADNPLNDLRSEERVQELRELLTADIQRLPSRQRQLMALHLLDRHTDAEIATVVGISVRAVKAQLEQGREALVAQMARALRAVGGVGAGSS